MIISNILMQTSDLSIQGNRLIIIFLFFTSCTNQLIEKSDLCDNNCSYWDIFPYSYLVFKDQSILYTTTYRFCMNDSVSEYVYYIEDSVRINCCPPYTRKLIIEENALIIYNDTIFIEKYLKDTLFVRHLIFDTIRHYKLVRNREFVKEEYIRIPEPADM